MDIPLLIRHFIAKYNAEMGKHCTGCSDNVMQVLKDHEWKGNVRELQNVIERAVIVAEGQSIEGKSMFDDCPLKHRACGGTPKNCRLFSQWMSAVRGVKELLAETTIATAAWHHPEHQFDRPPMPAVVDGKE